MEADKETTRITVALPSATVAKLDAYAAGHRWSRSTAAAALIETCLEKKEENDDGKDH